MITKDHELSISAQARLLNISRSTTYYTPRPPSAQDLTLMRQLDELHLPYKKHLKYCYAQIIQTLTSLEDF